MAKQLRLTQAVAAAMVDAAVDSVDSGTGTAYVKVYDGTQPANADTAVSTQTLLAELAFSATAFGGAADNSGSATATANAISDDTAANATGTASWFRVFDKDGTALWDGSVGTSDADMVVGTTSFVAGAKVEITSFTFSLPYNEA